MHSKIYTLIFCLFLSNSNYNQAANSYQNHTKIINGITHNQGGTLYFIPTDNDIEPKVKALTISHAHIHKIKGTQFSFMTLEKIFLSSIPELASFLTSNNKQLSVLFLQKCYINCLLEYNNCKIISSSTIAYNSTIPAPPIIDGNP